VLIDVSNEERVILIKQFGLVLLYILFSYEEDLSAKVKPFLVGFQQVQFG
jgi:hypothetical protein